MNLSVPTTITIAEWVVTSVISGAHRITNNTSDGILKLKALNLDPITYVQGEETRQQMNAELYLECLAKYQENVEDIFREATKRTLAFNRKQRNHKRKKKCVIL